VQNKTTAFLFSPWLHFHSFLKISSQARGRRERGEREEERKGRKEGGEKEGDRETYGISGLPSQCCQISHQISSPQASVLTSSGVPDPGLWKY
jgi:hypothetical protein